MKRASVLVVVSLVVLMAMGAAMATGNGGDHDGADEASHAHPDGVENCWGHDGITVGLIAGAIGIPTLVGAGYLYRRRQKKE